MTLSLPANSSPAYVDSVGGGVHTLCCDRTRLTAGCQTSPKTSYAMKSTIPTLIVFLVLFLGACTEQADQADITLTSDTATQDSNKAVMARIYDAFNTGDLSYVDDIMAPNMIEHQMMPGVESVGSEAFRQTVTMMRESFSDLRLDADHMVAEGDMVATLITMSGTQTGPMMGAPASGNQFRITGLDLVRFADGKAVEHWGYMEEVSMMEQLGMMPPSEEQPLAEEAPAAIEEPAVADQPVE